jgi:hypothetical protein
MKLSSSFLRLALIILVTMAVEGIWVWFAPHPMPIAAVIPATIPAWVSFFVIFPMVRESRRRKRQ